ncbi:MAG: UPF0149 family protein [Holosporaceae bacterium]|jgi:yecA family protein|nr:UPF0149 family protein [Holosporaceae bacterium]
MFTAQKNESFESLSNREIDELKNIISTFPNAPTFEMIDGFFTGTLCSPYESFPYSPMEKILSMEPIPSGEEALSVAFALLTRHWNSIEDLLLNGTFKPILEDGPNSGALWAQGFMMGINLTESELESLIEDEDTGMAFMPIFGLAFSGLSSKDIQEFLPDDQLEPMPITPELKQELIEILPHSAMLLYSMLSGNDYEEEYDDIITNPPCRPKIARNDPCSCGSGKKYKKCCSNKTEK